MYKFLLNYGNLLWVGCAVIGNMHPRIIRNRIFLSMSADYPHPQSLHVQLGPNIFHWRKRNISRPMF